MSDRLPKLLSLLQKQPNDAFLLYGVGMEHKKLGDFPAAIDHFRKTLIADPAYAYAYFQMGQTYELAGDVEAARQAYTEGVAAADRSGDAHARGEIAGALDALDDHAG